MTVHMESQKSGNPGALPFGCGAWPTPRPLQRRMGRSRSKGLGALGPHTIGIGGINAKFDCCWSNGMSVCVEICQKRLSPSCPAFQVTQGHRK